MHILDYVYTPSIAPLIPSLMNAFISDPLPCLNLPILDPKPLFKHNRNYSPSSQLLALTDHPGNFNSPPLPLSTIGFGEEPNCEEGREAASRGGP